MNDRNFYERRLGNPGYDAVARKKIKQLEKAVFGGTEMVEKVLYQTDNAEFMETNGAFAIQLENFPDINIGKTYKVELDGTLYECISADTPRPHIGNTFIMSETFPDTGEPFIITTISGDLVGLVAKNQYTRVKITTMEEQSVGGLGGSGGGNVVGFYVDPLGKWHCTETYADAKKLIFENCAAVTFVHMRDGIYYSDVYVQLYEVGTEYEYMNITIYKGSSSKGNQNFKIDGTFVAVPA